MNFPVLFEPTVEQTWLNDLEPVEPVISLKNFRLDWTPPVLAPLMNPPDIEDLYTEPAKVFRSSAKSAAKSTKLGLTNIQQ